MARRGAKTSNQEKPAIFERGKKNLQVRKDNLKKPVNLQKWSWVIGNAVFRRAKMKKGVQSEKKGNDCVFWAGG